MSRADDEIGKGSASTPATGPAGGQLSAIVRGLLVRFQFTRLAERHDSLSVLSLFSFVNGCLSIAIMAMLALVTEQAFIFPSLGLTAFLFFYLPLAPAASPRNAIFGHLIGVAARWGALTYSGCAMSARRFRKGSMALERRPPRSHSA